ncbi:MAG: WG repeat-containing protein, partial [Cytophagaceae bacterium]
SDTLIQAEIFGHTYLFFDSLGSLISSREFEEAGDFCEGRARVKYQDLWTFIDEHGNFIPEPRFGEVYDYYQGAALVKEKSQWGLMNRDGKYIVPPQYSEARPFHDGWAAVQKEGKWLYINERGEAGGKLRFDEADDFLHGTARVKYKKKYGFVDRNLTWQVKPQFRKMSVPGGNGVIAVSNKKKENWFLVNRQGKRISDRTFLSAGTWSEGLASVSGRDSTGKIRFGFIDTTGNLVVGLLYDKVSDFHEGLAAALLNGKWGYIGLDGFVIQPVFQLAGNFDLGYAEVYLKDKKMYTDQKGNYYSKIVRLPRTEETQSTALSKADSLHGIVRENRSYGMVDSSGAFLIPPVYGKIYDFKNGIARTKSGSYKGVLSLNGRVILKPTYNYVTHLNNGIIRVEKNGKIGYYQKDCKWIWPLAD